MGFALADRAVSFCSHAILQRTDEPLVVLDASKDWRFANNVCRNYLGPRSLTHTSLIAPRYRRAQYQVLRWSASAHSGRVQCWKVDDPYLSSEQYTNSTDLE